MFRIDSPLVPEFSMESAMLEAAALPGAQLFVFPNGGQVEAIVVIAPDRLIFELRSDNAAAWFDQLALRGLSGVEAEAALAQWCEWVPRLFRGVVLGVQSAEELASGGH